MPNAELKDKKDRKEKSEETEVLIDTSKMSRGKADALEIAESAREKEFTKPSFARQLFMGTVDFSMVTPFPEQSTAEKEIGDKLCAEVEAFLSANLNPDEVDKTRTIPDKVMDGLKKMKLFAMKVPKEYDGLGLSQVNYNRVMMRVSSYCNSTSVLLSAHQSIGVPEPLKLFGTKAQKDKFFPRFAQGAVSAFALTEPNVGSDPAQMAMTAKLTDDGKYYVINGDKLWCTNGPIADIMVVMAKTAPKIVGGKEKQQITALIVERSCPGIEVIHRCDFMGIRGIQNGFLRFTNVKVPVENRLWEEGRGLALALRTLNTGRLTIPAACTGAAKQLLSIARRWGKERKQWGSSIGLLEAGADKIADITSMTMAAEAVTWLTSHWSDKKEFDIRIEAAMAKLFCSEAAWRIADQTLQLRGGRGFETGASLTARGEVGYPVERIMRDIRINTIIEGTSEVMRLILAREALDPHLGVIEPLLSKRTSFGQKVAGAFKALGFYAGWYPRQWLNGSLFNTHSDKGELSREFQFIDRTAHKMARKTFHKMAKYGPGLESRQIILAQLVSVATELFAMSAICSYATMLYNKNRNDRSPLQVAEHFCAMAKRRINAHFDRLRTNEEAISNDVAKRVLDKEMTWLENGIVWFGPKD